MKAEGRAVFSRLSKGTHNWIGGEAGDWGGSFVICESLVFGCDFVGEYSTSYTKKYTNLQKIIVEQLPSDGVF